MHVTTEDLTVRFADTTALDGLDLTIEPGRITGLLGRNGAGKTTLMRVLAGYLRPSAGTVLVDAAAPFEDADRMAATVLIRDEQSFCELKVRDRFAIAAAVRSRFDREWADQLAERFKVPLKKSIGQLSQGQRSAVGIIVGLASRAELTMFDEPHLGLDAPSRYAFYELLLADYAQHPRTIVLSTHVIDEVADLLEDVVVLHDGQRLLSGTVDGLRAGASELTGPAAAVESLVAGHHVLATRRLGPTLAAVVQGGDLPQPGPDDGVTVTPVSLQDLFVHLTGDPTPSNQEETP